MFNQQIELDMFDKSNSICHNGLKPMWFYVVNIPPIFKISLANMPI